MQLHTKSSTLSGLILMVVVVLQQLQSPDTIAYIYNLFALHHPEDWFKAVASMATFIVSIIFLYYGKPFEAPSETVPTIQLPVVTPILPVTTTTIVTGPPVKNNV